MEVREEEVSRRGEVCISPSAEEGGESAWACCMGRREKARTVKRERGMSRDRRNLGGGDAASGEEDVDTCRLKSRKWMCGRVVERVTGRARTAIARAVLVIRAKPHNRSRGIA